MLNANLERLHKTFDEISKVDDENGIEYWKSTGVEYALSEMLELSNY